MRIRLAWVFFLAVTFVTTTFNRAGAIGGRPPSVPDPNDTACPEDQWPYYYYRHPVIFQAIGEDGTLALVGFGYMDACKQNGKGERGGTYSTIQEVDEVWVPDVMEKLRNWPLGRINEALPGIDHPGDNVFRWDLPPIPSLFKQMYTDAARSVCHYRDWQYELVCPGIPPVFGAQVLKPAGYERYTDKFGLVRWKEPKANIWGAWFKSNLSTQPPNPPESFYARHWADDMRANHSDGGLIRVILNPVNLVLWKTPAETKLTKTGEAVVSMALTNDSTRSQLRTTLGWRLKGETQWKPVEGWRYKGDTEWKPYSAPIGPLPHQTRSQSGTLEGYSTRELEVRLTGRQDRDEIEIMVNETKTIPEAAINGGQWDDAFADNIVRTKLVAATNLKVVSLTVPATAACTVGGRYQVTWTLENQSDKPQQVRRTARVTTGRTGAWAVADSTITLQPGTTVESDQVSVGRCSDTATVTVELNPDRTLEETTYDDNQASRSTAIGAQAAGPSPGIGGSGETRHLIVPADCQPDPDPTSEYPCLNYPNLRIPN